MKLPELPPGCALDPGWTDDHHGHVGARKGNGIGNVLAKTTDKDELEALAAAQALREARIELWRDLYQRMTTAEKRLRAVVAVLGKYQNNMAMTKSDALNSLTRILQGEQP